jgi:hypothetical protein
MFFSPSLTLASGPFIFLARFFRMQSHPVRGEPMRLPKPVLVLSLLAAIAIPLRAQSGGSVPSDSVRSRSDSAQTTITTPESSKGASLTGLRAGVHVRENAPLDRPAMAAAATRANLGQARAMMVVGVAALIAGAIIGGDAGTIVMVGGTVIGLIGLYDYLQ